MFIKLMQFICHLLISQQAATTSDTNITDRFDLDTGQRDNFYDIGRIVLKNGELTPTGRLLVDFDFFSHGSGDYFDVDSYSGVVNYEDIPKNMFLIQQVENMN